MTKYNQIYYFLSDDLSATINKQKYKALIKDLYGFDYGNSEIKGKNDKHQLSLNNLSVNFNEV